MYDTIILTKREERLSKRLILTGVLALCTLVPAYADDSFITNESKCDSDTLGSTESATLIAQWTPNQYSISYDCGTGTGTPPAATNVTYDQNYTFAAATGCTKTGYTFDLWSCTGGLGNRAASSVYKWQITTPVTCTATWSANSIALDWDPDNGSAHMNSSCTYDGTISLPAQPSKTGYTFGGWQVVTPTP